VRSRIYPRGSNQATSSGMYSRGLYLLLAGFNGMPYDILWGFGLENSHAPPSVAQADLIPSLFRKTSNKRLR